MNYFEGFLCRKINKKWYNFWFRLINVYTIFRIKTDGGKTLVKLYFQRKLCRVNILVSLRRYSIFESQNKL